MRNNDSVIQRHRGAGNAHFIKPLIVSLFVLLLATSVPSAIAGSLSGDDHNRSSNQSQLGMVCGDADGSGVVNISDAVYYINYIFDGGPAPMDPTAGDYNCDGSHDLSDVVALIQWLFVSGYPPCGEPNCAPSIRGINFANALEAPPGEDWGLTITSDYVTKAAQAGFQFIRLPVKWSAYAAANSPYTVSSDIYTKVDQVIGWAFANNLGVVFDMHNYDELIADPAANHDRFVGIWRQLANHYKNYSDKLQFELLNEPNSDLTSDLWNQYYSDALAAVRETNPTRKVVIGPVQWNSYLALSSLQLPANDPNIIVTIHYYDPFEFTHQGAEWIPGSNAWLGTTWDGTAGQKQEVVDGLKIAADWGAAHNIHIYLGEFGAYSTGDMDSRVRWTSFVARTAESMGMFWSYWEFGAGFGAYDQVAQAWRSGLLHALIP